MDRYLFSGALALLILQVYLLLSDLGITGAPMRDIWSKNNDQVSIGRMVKIHDSVKRKAVNSILWDKPDLEEKLFAYDSILTLEDSSAELQLQGDISLKLHENTLVVLEPPENENDDSLKVSFQRGLFRSRNRGQKLNVGSLGWSIQAEAGSDLSVRALDDENIELEVSSGEIQIQKNNSEISEQITSGQKVSLGREAHSDVQIIDDDLAFTDLPPARIYSHYFPLALEVAWKGKAEALEVFRLGHERKRMPLTEGNKINLFLQPGTTVMNLVAGNRISKSFTFEARPAPQLKYLSPLPRDRIDLEKPEIFSWRPLEGIDSYQVEIVPNKGPTPATYPTHNTYTEVTYPKPASADWQVTAKDADGFFIPAFYSLPVYFTRSPLGAPKLREPAKESVPSDTKKEKVKDQSFLLNIYNLIFPSAYAEDNQRKIILSWFPVEGADFYIIEISKEPDFLKPIVMKKVTTEEFAWHNFSNKKYYWRVAAGQEGGRMGIFSEVAEFDVSLLKSMPLSTLSPGVKYIEAAPEPPPKKIEPPKPIPPAKPIVKAEPPQEINAEQLLNSLSFQISYFNIQQSDQEFRKASYHDAAVPSLRYSKNIRLFKKRWKTDITYKYLIWKPAEPSSTPFQPDLKTNIFHFQFSAARINSIGLGIRSLPILKRVDLEELDVNSKTLFGLFYRWTLAMDKDINWNSSFELNSGSSYHAIGWENQFTYSLSKDPEVKDSKKWIEANLNALTTFDGGNKHSGQWIEIGLGYGWSW